MLLIPVYGYMASAWAHVASYGSMIIMSFILAKKYYRIEYKMKELVPYFVIVIGIVIFSRVFHYKNLSSELVINSGLLIIFLMFAQYKDQLFTVFIRKKRNENQDSKQIQA